MSDPIALRADDGTVYAWACSACQRVPTPLDKLVVVLDDQAVAELAEWLRQEAESCCRCRNCQTVAPEQVRGSYEVGRFGWCDACWEAHEPERARRDQELAETVARERRLYQDALAKAADPDAAEHLHKAMSELSEDCWCAGWLSGCEHRLWRAVLDVEGVGGFKWGVGTVTEADLQRLRRLHEQCAGWWAWNETAQLTLFVPIEEWRALHAEHLQRFAESG